MSKDKDSHKDSVCIKLIYLSEHLQLIIISTAACWQELRQQTEVDLPPTGNSAINKTKVHDCVTSLLNASGLAPVVPANKANSWFCNHESALLPWTVSEHATSTRFSAERVLCLNPLTSAFRI